MNLGRFLPEEVIAVASMVSLVLITLLNVVTRYLTNESYAWTEEVSVLLMVILALAGASAVAKRDKHIRIEFLFFGRNAEGKEIERPVLRRLSDTATCIAFLILTVLFSRWVFDQYTFQETSMGLGIPIWWYAIAVPFLCFAIACRALVRLIQYRSNRDSP